jgi:hypothetical protein
MSADQMLKSFGGAEVYYSGKRASPHFASTARVELLKVLLDEIDRGFKAKIQNAAKDWNRTIRDRLAAETGLRMTGTGERQLVKVNVIDGLPSPVDELISEFPNPITWKLILHQKDFESASRCIALTQRELEQIESLLQLPPTEERRKALKLTQSLVTQTILKLGETPLLKKLYAIEMDILGAYHFNAPCITLHWMVIALLSANLGLSVDALTVVTLAHELAHAFTHVGQDIDGVRWPTAGFSKSNLSVLEGLAQYYTEAALRNYAASFPEGLTAFHALREKQSAPYKEYVNWCDKSIPNGEVIRACLLEARQKGEITLKDFQALVTANRARIRAREKQKEQSLFPEPSLK